MVFSRPTTPPFGRRRSESLGTNRGESSIERQRRESLARPNYDSKGHFAPVTSSDYIRHIAQRPEEQYRITSRASAKLLCPTCKEPKGNIFCPHCS